MKKILTVVFCFFLVAFFSVSCFRKSENTETSQNIKVVLLTDAAGVDDKSYNAAVWRGILSFYNDNGAGKGNLYTNVTAQSSDDYILNMRNAAAFGYDLIITTGFTWGETVETFTARYPHQKVVIVDVNYLTDRDNLIQYAYKEEQGAYLVGIVAAMQAKADGISNPKFGFIGGIPGALITKFEIGYIEGILSVYPDAEIVDYYANDWGAPQLAKTVAKQWYDSGVYCIFSAAGPTGNGAIDQAKEYRKAGKNVRVIGVDSDRYEDGVYESGKSAVLTSLLKFVENAAVDALTKVKNGTWKGGIVLQDISNGGLGYSTANAELDADAKKAAENAKNDILSGKIVVDKTYQEFVAKYPGFAGKLGAIDD